MDQPSRTPEDLARLRERAEVVTGADKTQTVESMSPEENGRILQELRVHQIELQLQNDELRRAQVELDTARARYFDLYDLAPVGYCTLNDDGLILEANLTAARMLGVGRSSLPKRRFTSFILPEDNDQFYLQRRRLRETGEQQVSEVRLVRADGTPFWALLEAVTAQGAEDLPVLRVVISDITARKQAEEKLRRSNALLAGINQVFNEVMVGKSESELAQTYLETAKLLTGSSLGFLATIGPDGSTHVPVISDPGWEHFTIPEEKGQPRQPGPLRISELCNQVLREGNSVSLSAPAGQNVFIGTPNGAPPAASFLGLPLVENGRITGVIGVGRCDRGYEPHELETLEALAPVMTEIMHRKRVEDALRQAQRLESVGRLAGGVAHEFNNLLTVINGYSQLLVDRMNSVDPSRPYAVAIKTAGVRAATLTSQLLAFGRKQTIRPRVLELNSTVGAFVQMLQRLIGENITLVTKLEPELGKVMADPDQLHQVLMNLILNARDAMPRGGKLEIATDNVTLGADEMAAIDPEAVPGRYVRLKISDTGQGMDATTRRRVFEPFFTTKGVGEGTGLGLATVYGIVRQSGGWIEVQSETGMGTAFQICLPRIDEPAAAAAEASRPEIRGGRETILALDDEESVVALVRSVLQDYGYQVLTAMHGEEALALAQSHPGRIHLLLADAVMPGMSGKEASRQLRKLYPELKVVFMSGHNEDGLDASGVIGKNAAFIQKPFHPDDLAAMVREMLDASAARAS